MGRRLGWLCAVILAGTTLAVPNSSRAQQEGTAPIREGFQAATDQSFADSFPHGKLSVVQRQVAGTAALLSTAHRLALRGDKARARYRDALVYQAAAQCALDDEQFVEALYLTLHARSLGRGVIRANTARTPKEYQPDDSEIIKRAGGVDAAQVEGCLDAAGEDVPALELLFVEGGEQ
jgi:hypothetical protein